MKKILFIVSALLLSGCSNEFDVVCDSFETLSRLGSLDQMSGIDRDKFVMNELRKIDPEGSAKKGWTYARFVVPVEERYTLFKQAVDSIDGGDWTCEAMAELAPTLDPDYIPEGSDKAETKSVEVTSMADAVFDEE